MTIEEKKSAHICKSIASNPELPAEFVSDTLLAAAEARAGLLTPYEFAASPIDENKFMHLASTAYSK